MNEMRVGKLWNEIRGMGKKEKPREKQFRPPLNPHGVNDNGIGGWSSTYDLPARLLTVVNILFLASSQD